MFKRAACLIIFISVSFACGSDSSDDSGLAAELAPGLNGVWGIGCEQFSESSETNEISISGGTFTSTTVIFATADTSCSSRQLTLSNTITTTITESATAGIYELDGKVTGFTVTGHIAEVVDQYNSVSFCGKSDWVIDGPVDLFVEGCSADLLENTEIFDIIQISDDQQTLSFGANDAVNDGSTAAKRATSIDPESAYTKQ